MTQTQRDLPSPTSPHGVERPTRPITFEAQRSGKFLTLRQSWIDGESADGVSFSLDSGAGLGSPLLTLTVRVDGEVASETIDIRDGLTAWVNAIVAEIKGEADAVETT